MTKSLAGKVVLGLLVLAFAMWGISDVFRGQSKTTVAAVGDESISTQTLSSEFRRDMQRLQRYNPKLTTAEAHKAGLTAETLRRLVGEALVRQEAKRLRLVAVDAAVSAEIARQPAFHDDQGNFERTRYKIALEQSRLTPESYENIVREDLKRNQLIQAVAAELPAPATLTEAIYRYRQEKRNALLALVPRDEAATLAEPDDAALQSHLDQNQEQFKLPEYRTASYLRLTPEALVAEIELSDADVEAEYEARTGEFQVPESRTVEQILSRDRALIDEGKQKLDAGNTFAQVAEYLTAKGATLTALNDLTRAGLPEKVAGPVFALSQDKPSEPVETGFGWALFRVKEIKPAHTKTFPEVRDQLHKEMALRLAGDSLIRLSKQVDDALAGGATLADAGHAVNVSPVTITINALGNAKDGTDALAVPERDRIIDALFKLEAGTESGLQETEAGTYFVIKLDRIEEARVPSLEEGRANVRAAWQIAERNKAALTAAEALAAAIKGGATLSEAAKAKGYELIEANDLMRRQQTTVRGLTGEIQHRLFEERPDAPGPIVGAFPDGYVVAMLKAVATPDNATEKAAVENLAKEIGRSRASEIYQTFQFALQEHFPVSFYAKVFNSTFPSTE